MKKRILTIGLLAVLLSVLVVTPASASPDTLVSTGAIGTNNAAEVVILAPGDGTLGAILSIEWSAYVLEGYAPHIDIRLDTNDDGTADDALVIEYAYNGPTHYAEPGGMPYGVTTNTWFRTFADDTDGPSVVDNNAFAWLASGAPGPYPDGAGFIGGTLAEWKVGGVAGDTKGISASTKVIDIHLETDNWVVDSISVVDNILVNTASVVTLAAEIIPAPVVVKVSVAPTNINFGILYPGSESAEFTVTVTNVGTVTVDALPVVTDTAGNVIALNLVVTGDLTNLAPGESATVQVKLVVPAGATIGSMGAELSFDLTPQS